MRLHRLITLFAVAIVLSASTQLQAAVNVTALDPETSETPEGQRVAQTVVLASENAHYALTYDVIHDPDSPGDVTSHWWQWTTGYITLGMTEPSGANFYWQGFLRWTFDDLSLHTKAAQFSVVRDSGQDGMVEYLWDTEKVRARLRFALTTGSDKLLLFADWEPKEPIAQTQMTLAVYPATFPEPRNRRVTTTLGTREQGPVTLDLTQERWMLLEDVTEGRPASGSAGVLIGTPDAFESVSVPSIGYMCPVALRPAQGARSFGVGLYDFPTLPDYLATRAYFERSADTEARQIGEMAAGDLSRPLPPMPIDAERAAELNELGEGMLDRPAELWRPDPEPLDFPWAADLPGGPIRTGIFCRRWCAWETMELARRLEIDAEHIYFDGADRLVNPRAWPYAAQTGIGPLPRGVAARKAADIATDESMELFLVGGVQGAALPGVARTAILEQVAAGSGLLIVGNAGVLEGWPEELLASEDPQMTADILKAFPDLGRIPGFREGDRGRVSGQPPIRSFRYGDGRVVHLNVNLNTYSSLVPRNDASEGLAAATDRCLAVAARCALAAAGRSMTTTPEDGETALLRVQDDLGRTLILGEYRAEDLPGLPALPADRRYFIDRVIRNATGQTVGLVSEAREPTVQNLIEDLAITPSVITHEPAVPMVKMPDGGTVECSATLLEAIEGPAELRWEVRDAFDRVVARAVSQTNGEQQASVTVNLPRPVTPCHVLDVALLQDGREIAFERRRFTMAMDYPYDDFTALLWTYAGGDPILRRTDRMCYEWGADMCDLCHMGGYSDAGAAREYEVSARSGLRLIPYVTRIAGTATSDYVREPCLHDPEREVAEREKLTTTCRQAAAYSPAAYTLGDENYLFRGEFECCHSEWSVAAFREWLERNYDTIEALNDAWATQYDDFGQVEPMILTEAAEQTESFAPWIDHKLFMDTAFAEAHRRYAGYVRAQDPGAKVGWDGLLSYGWRSGYDFSKLTDGLDLNETYTLQFLQGELYRSFKADDCLSGKWGNAVADNEAGWHAFPWDCLLAGDNSVWWWTSWGCDYVPFNPDLSQSKFGRWFFEAVKETTSGPGRLLLAAGRQHSPIAVLYSQADMFAATIAGQIVENQPWAGDGGFLSEHQTLLRAIRDLGYQYRHITPQQLEKGLSPDDYRVLVLPQAVCISDRMAAAIERFVRDGGTVLADGRVGLLTGDGRLRDERPLDALLGVRSASGMDGFTAEMVTGPATITGAIGEVPLDLPEVELGALEPALTADGATALGEVADVPIVCVNEVGRGRTVLLNLLVRDFEGRRRDDGPKPILEIIGATLWAAGVEPHASVTTTDGGRPVCVQQVIFGNGPARYLALQQDILVRSDLTQQLRISLPEPAFVYDMRSGRQVGDGPTDSWEAEISRGNILVYALLPYEVVAVRPNVPAVAQRGATMELAIAVEVEGRAADHVVRMDVYAPGSDEPHRQYSQNVMCAGGAGAADIPFALSDASGRWRLAFRDVASGVSAWRELVVR